MPAHWTYAPFDRDSDLEQGDILKPSPAMRKLFSEVHPHFCNEKYIGFMVATQTCDLVKRKGVSKAAYVSLAVIRPLAQVLHKLIGSVVTPVAPGRFPASKRAEARNLLERLFNQNEQALGLFFLYQDADSGIGEQAVAMLRVTVSVRSEHYQELIDARTGRLGAQFQAKLGWLCGNLFNRPASPDWSDRDEGEKKLNQIISEHLKEQIPGFGPTWIDDVLIDEAKTKGVDLATASVADLEQLRPPEPVELALEVITAELAKVAGEVPLDQVTKLQNRLRNNGKFKRLFARK